MSKPETFPRLTQIYKLDYDEKQNQRWELINLKTVEKSEFKKKKKEWNLGKQHQNPIEDWGELTGVGWKWKWRLKGDGLSSQPHLQKEKGRLSDPEFGETEMSN